jgi:hypothetical protein
MCLMVREVENCAVMTDQCDRSSTSLLHWLRVKFSLSAEISVFPSKRLVRHWNLWGHGLPYKSIRRNSEL